MITLICRATKACIFLILYYASLSPLQASQATFNQRIDALDNEFIRLSETFLQDTSSYTSESSQVHPDVVILLNYVNKLIESKQDVRAVQLLYANKKTLNENIDSKAIFDIIDILLNLNQLKLANSLYSIIKAEGDQSLLAPVKFSYAKFYTQRHKWKQVVKLLEGTFSELSDENAAYAYLINGTALQHLKKHRLAVKSYEKISVKSQFYNYAQLNIAIANIRQGWWTDAQTRIENLITHTTKSGKNELTNRLYLILGYALLQREYYRDARNAFRHIGLNSRYTNRALLGIGLTATSQGDYVGGLNALSILKNKKTYDLSVDESYLLVPYVYEKLQQELTVNTSYTEAMNYYHRRIEILNSIISKNVDLSSIVYSANLKNITIHNNTFNYASKYTESFLHNINLLNKYKKISNNSSHLKSITNLQNKYALVYQNIINDLAAQRKEYLRSYLNQSRYGLARLYDNSKQKSY